MARTNICRHDVDGMRPAHPEGLDPSHRLAGQMPERDLDRFCLGPDPVAAHDRLDVVVLDLDVRPLARHTPIVHQNAERERADKPFSPRQLNNLPLT